ncbi:MAG TPA: proton-conducting transporter membrane subunit, partial [Myxococcaceae bacterium]|nr:proton-conducting transporter membrane subunit [Myxococcaceae bacterium]
IEDGRMPREPLVAAAVLMGVGAATKSAQVPFQGWLPSAMVAPTPVSALLHSATMVAAGVVLVVRLMPAFRASGVLPAFAWVGVATALLGGAVALVEENLKRALAYSTLSQLGFMFVALGADSLVAGMVLLVCHACYKSLLFLGAGALKRAVGGEELSRMRGVGRHMRWTFAAFALGALALSGLPVTVALPPKDPALAAALHHGQGLFALALLASLLTALYSARLATQLLARPLGEERAPEPHEVNRGILASVLVGAALVPGVLLVDARWLGSPLGTLLEGHTPHSSLALGLSLGVAALGVLAGVWATLRWPAAHGWPWLHPAVRPLEAELGLKPLYRAVAQGCVWLVKAVDRFDRVAFIRPVESFARGVLRVVRGAGRFEERGLEALPERSARATVRVVRASARFDERGPEALPERSARATVRVVRASARFDVRALDRAARALGGGLVRTSGTLLPVQTGRVDNYLLVAFAGTAAVVGLAVLVALLA